MKKIYATSAERQAAATKRLIDAGGRVVRVRMPPELSALLATECGKTGESANAAILRLLQNSLE